jgi:hypothetical protein
VRYLYRVSWIKPRRASVRGHLYRSVAPTGTNASHYCIGANFPPVQHAAPSVLRLHAGIQLLNYSPPTHPWSLSLISFFHSHSVILISILFSRLSFSSHTSISPDPTGAGASQRRGRPPAAGAEAGAGAGCQRPAWGPPKVRVASGRRGCELGSCGIFCSCTFMRSCL